MTPHEVARRLETSNCVYQTPVLMRQKAQKRPANQKPPNGNNPYSGRKRTGHHRLLHPKPESDDRSRYLQLVIAFLSPLA